MNIEKVEKQFLHTNNDDSRLIKDLKTALATKYPEWEITQESIDAMNQEGASWMLVVKKDHKLKRAEFKDGEITLHTI